MRFPLICLISILSVTCSQFIEKPVQFDPGADPFTRLSDYHFYRGNPADLRPNDRILPYDLNTPLFTDYAEKLRFVWMPEGVSGTYNDSTVFDLPVGTILIKNFYYPDDFRQKNGSRNILETRLLVHVPDGWRGLPYIWNDEQTEAYLQVAGGEKPVQFINNKGETVRINYLIPNANQCRSCHVQNGKMEPIGPAARHLNKDFSYNDGQLNQLVRWHESGYLVEIPDTEIIPRLSDYLDPSTGSVELRARAYLDINCRHCHNPLGPAKTSGLFLSSDVENPTALGIMKPPVAAGRGSGGKNFSILPGNPDDSILLYRMDSTEPGIMMPELGRSVVDKEAVQLIREWIEGMK